MPYLSLAEFELLSVFPHVDELQTEIPGWIEAQIEAVSEEIDSRLRKRYVTPFASPVPHTIRRWVSRIVTRECYLRRGVDPLDPQWVSIEAAAQRAEAEVREAADAVSGLYDLPLRADVASSAITGPVPHAYTETSPYVWRDVQARRGRDDDARGDGEIE